MCGIIGFCRADGARMGDREEPPDPRGGQAWEPAATFRPGPATTREGLRTSPAAEWEPRPRTRSRQRWTLWTRWTDAP